MTTQTTMEVKEIFTLTDGKSIFLGPLHGGPVLITPGKWTLLVNKIVCFEVDILGEQLMTRRKAKSDYRALSSRTPIDKKALDTANDVVELVLTT